MAFIDSIDTYYSWVLQQMQTVDSSLVPSFKGNALASDWPQEQINDGDIWLLYLTTVPIGGTKAAPLYNHFLQWTWMLLGNDIQAQNIEANRGSRYRDHLAIQEALRQANYPGFAQKASVTVNMQTGAGTFAQSNPEEMIRWTELKMPSKLPTGKGVLYGVAAVEVQAYDVIPANIDATITSIPPQVTV
jgi:hypothetical protein